MVVERLGDVPEIRPACFVGQANTKPHAAAAATAATTTAAATAVTAAAAAATTATAATATAAVTGGGVGVGTNKGSTNNSTHTYTHTSNGTKGLNQAQQQEVLRRFNAGAVNVLVATSVAEEGLDIDEVDLIVLFDNVASPIRLVQRSGRTGVAGEDNIADAFTKP